MSGQTHEANYKSDDQEDARGELQSLTTTGDARGELLLGQENQKGRSGDALGELRQKLRGINS